MTHHTRMMIVAIAVMLLISGAAHARSLSLGAAIEEAMGKAPSVLARESAVDAAGAGVENAEAQLMPRLNFSETFVRTDNPVGVFAAKLNQGKFTAADFAIPSLNNPRSVNNWITRIELNAPIIHSGVNWARRSAAQEGRNAAKHMMDFERSSIVLATKRLYYTAAALDLQRRAVDDGIRRLRALEGSYQLMDEPTSASTTSYLVAKSVRENLEAERIKIECERKKALRDLNAILGEDPESPLTLTDPLPSVEDAMAVAGAEETRSDVEASAASVRAKNAERKAALRRWGPNLDFFGAYEVYTGDFKSAEGSYGVGARLSWPIFDWGRHANIHRAKAEHARASHLHRAAVLKAEADLKTAEQRVHSCVRRYRNVQKAFYSAREALNQASARYEEGTLPLMDYSQAIQNWVQMKLNSIQNKLEVAAAHADYDFQLGNV